MTAGKPFPLLDFDVFKGFYAGEQEFIPHLHGVYFVNIAVNEFRIGCIFKVFICEVEALLCLV